MTLASRNDDETTLKDNNNNNSLSCRFIDLQTW